MLQRGGTWRPEDMPLDFDKQELSGASLAKPKFRGGGTVQGGEEQCRFEQAKLTSQVLSWA